MLSHCLDNSCLLFKMKLLSSVNYNDNCVTYFSEDEMREIGLDRKYYLNILTMSTRLGTKLRKKQSYTFPPQGFYVEHRGFYS